MMASSRIFTAISIVLICGVVQSPANATDWFVSDGSCGNGTAQTPFCKIQEGINAAQSGDRVYVAQGTYIGTGNTNLTFPTVPTPRSITVIGNGATIDCQGNSGVRGVTFSSDGGQSSTLQGFTICRGNATSGGGGILVSSASPRIDGNVIEDCVAQGYGGGINVSSGSPLILNNTIRRNQSVGNGSVGGGIATASNGTVTIYGNLIQDNRADWGGGINAWGMTSGKVTIQDSTIELNVAGTEPPGGVLESGGGVLLSSGSKFLVTGCKILRNSAPGTGGGIYMPNGTATIVNTLIAGNGTVPGQATPSHGGGFGCCKSNENGRPSIVNCIITHNKAKDAGGGVYLYEAGNGLDVSNTVFAYNEVISGTNEGKGGGLYAQGLDGLAVRNCTFAYNKYTGADAAGHGGGGIAFQGTNGTIANTHAWGNQATGDDDSGSQLFVEGQTGIVATVRWSNFQFGQPRVKFQNTPTVAWDASNLPGTAAPTFLDPDGPDNDVSNWVGDDFRLGLGSPGNDLGNNIDIAEDLADLDGDGITAEKVPFAINGGRRGDDPAAADAGAPAGDLPFVDMGPYERCKYLTGVVGDANTLPSNRFLSMSVPSLDPANERLAIRVTLVDLQNPNPPNLPQYPPPNFGGFESGTCAPQMCVGGPRNRLVCTDSEDCAGGACAMKICEGGTQNLEPCTLSTHCPGGACTPFEQNACIRWVGKPGTFYEAQGPPQALPYRAARLQCTPHYDTWGSVGVFHVTGAEIVPSSIYEVQTFAAACEQSGEGTCQDVSCPVQVRTTRAGDITWNLNPPATTSQPDAMDVSEAINAFKHLLGAPMKAITQLQPNLPELNADVNALDITAVVDALKFFAYAFSGPCPCPSLVPCGPADGSFACADPTVCVTVFGPESMCVKTCVGGNNDGESCLNIAHCPGGTSCGNAGPNSGYCRDRCGRCTP